MKNVDFWNSLPHYLMNSKVNFKNPCFSIFFNSDWKFVFFDKNCVGKMPHIIILVQNSQIRRKIRNRLIKISWNQLIFLSHQSWLESHLYWIYNWFLKIPTGNLLFRAFYAHIKWADWPFFSENDGLCWFFIRNSKKAIKCLFDLWQSPTHTQNSISKFQGPGLGRGHFGL